MSAMKWILDISRLSVLGLAVVCFCHAVCRPAPKGAIEWSVSPTAKSTLCVNPTDSGVYVLSVCYEVRSLPNYVGTVGLPLDNKSNVVWHASLRAATDTAILIDSMHLDLKPSSQIGDQQYFALGGWTLGSGERLEIALVPKEPCPLGPSPRLALRPNVLYYKARATRQLAWSFAYVICLVLVLLVLLELLVHYYRVRRQSRTEP